MTDRVRIEAEGLFLERFVDRALEAGVRFSLIRRLDERHVLLETDSPGAREVLALLEAYHLRGRVAGTAGWPRLRGRLKARWTLLCGLLICAGLLAAFSGFVWRVEVADRSGAPVNAEVLDALEDWGAHLPMRRRDVDTQLIRLRLLSRFPEYSYAGVRVSGATLRVELVRADAEPEVYDLAASRDLVALEGGVVLSVTVLDGAAAVQPGDTVQKGQLLIRGEERVSKEETRGVRARGEVMARVWRESECTLPLWREETAFTGRVSRGSTLALGGYQWTLTGAESFEHFEEETRELPLGGMFAPLRLIDRTRRETVLRRAACDPAQVEAQARELALQGARAQLLPGEEEVAFSAERTVDGDTLTVRVLLEARAQIAGGRGERRERRGGGLSDRAVPGRRQQAAVGSADMSFSGKPRKTREFGNSNLWFPNSSPCPAAASGCRLSLPGGSKRVQAQPARRQEKRRRARNNNRQLT